MKSGTLAVDNSEYSEFDVHEGKHAKHSLSMLRSKEECGVWSEELHCSCEATFRNAMDGCQFHNRPEEGDESLKELLPHAIVAIESAQPSERIFLSASGHIPFGIEW